MFILKAPSRTSSSWRRGYTKSLLSRTSKSRLTNVAKLQTDTWVQNCAEGCPLSRGSSGIYQTFLWIQLILSLNFRKKKYKSSSEVEVSVKRFLPWDQASIQIWKFPPAADEGGGCPSPVTSLLAPTQVQWCFLKRSTYNSYEAGPFESVL